MVSPFILHYFSFSLTGEWKGEKLLKRCWWIAVAYINCPINGQTHVYMIASFVKIINKCNVFAMYQFKSARMCFGLLFANTTAAKIIIKKVYDDRLVDCFHHVLIHNLFMLIMINNYFNIGLLHKRNKLFIFYKSIYNKNFEIKKDWSLLQKVRKQGAILKWYS